MTTNDRSLREHMQVRFGFLAAILAGMIAAHPGAQGTPPPAAAGPGAQQAPPPQTQPPPAGRGGQGRGRGPGTFPAQQRTLADAATIERGKAVYSATCSACHGADLRGGQLGGPN